MMDHLLYSIYLYVRLSLEFVIRNKMFHKLWLKGSSQIKIANFFRCVFHFSVNLTTKLEKGDCGLENMCASAKNEETLLLSLHFALMTVYPSLQSQPSN